MTSNYHSDIYLLTWGRRKDGSCRLQQISRDIAHGFMRMSRTHTIRGRRNTVHVILYPDGSYPWSADDCKTAASRWWRGETKRVTLVEK